MGFLKCRINRLVIWVGQVISLVCVSSDSMGLGGPTGDLAEQIDKGLEIEGNMQQGRCLKNNVVESKRD